MFSFREPKPFTNIKIGAAYKAGLSESIRFLNAVWKHGFHQNNCKLQSQTLRSGSNLDWYVVKQAILNRSPHTVVSCSNESFSFKWEWPILHPSSLSCTSFFGGRKEASRKLSFEWNILNWIGHYTPFGKNPRGLVQRTSTHFRPFLAPPPPLSTFHPLLANPPIKRMSNF